MATTSLYYGLDTAAVLMTSSRQRNSAYSSQYEQSSKVESELDIIVREFQGQTDTNNDAASVDHQQDIQARQLRSMPSATHQQATISSSMPPLHYSAASSPMTCPESFRSPKHTTERFQKILCDNPKSMTAQSTTYNVVDTATQLTPSLLCPKCGVAHASSPDEDSEPGPPQNPRKKFDCDRCDKQFSRQQDARRHMNSIHLKKTYTCDICCRNFSRSDVFKRHLSSSQQHMAGGQRPRQQHHREPRITRRTSRRNANT